MRFHVLSMLFTAAFSFAIIGCGGDSSDVSNPEGDASEQEAGPGEEEMYNSGSQEDPAGGSGEGGSEGGN